MVSFTDVFDTCVDFWRSLEYRFPMFLLGFWKLFIHRFCKGSLHVTTVTGICISGGISGGRAAKQIRLHHHMIYKV